MTDTKTKEPKMPKLLPKQELFVRYYFGGFIETYTDANGDEKTKKYRFNATRAYAKAYDYDISDPKKESTCSTEGGKLLRNPEIQEYARAYIDNELGCNGRVIDARLTQIVKEGRDKDSIAAAKELNHVKARAAKAVAGDEALQDKEIIIQI